MNGKSFFALILLKSCFESKFHFWSIELIKTWTNFTTKFKISRTIMKKWPTEKINKQQRFKAQNDRIELSVSFSWHQAEIMFNQANTNDNLIERSASLSPWWSSRICARQLIKINVFFSYFIVKSLFEMIVKFNFNKRIWKKTTWIEKIIMTHHTCKMSFWIAHFCSNDFFNSINAVRCDCWCIKLNIFYKILWNSNELQFSSHKAFFEKNNMM